MAQLSMKEKALRGALASLGSVCVAYSGGIDSTLLLYVAREVLGERACAVTVASPFIPERDIRQASELAHKLGVPHTRITLDLLNEDTVRANTLERCYWCKRRVMAAVGAHAARLGLDSVVDGTHVEDLPEHRPGIKALRELGVKSPLQEAGLTKQEIRELARRHGIPVWDRPSTPCLATRIPFGTPLTSEVLEQVAGAEEVLGRLGFSQVRVRHYGSIARIEVPLPEMHRMFEEGVRSSVVAELQAAGYVYVTLDLAGYRSGSMDEVFVGPRPCGFSR